jgi:hypothetical protein
MRIWDLQKEVRRINAEHGWDSTVPHGNPAVFSDKLFLVVSELVEALEEFRNNKPINEIYFQFSGVDIESGRGYTEHHNDFTKFNKDPANHKPEGVPIEIADAVIRILDFVEANGINLELALLLKMKYNETRPFRHGGKLV